MGGPRDKSHGGFVKAMVVFAKHIKKAKPKARPKATRKKGVKTDTKQPQTEPKPTATAGVTVDLDTEVGRKRAESVIGHTEAQTASESETETERPRPSRRRKKRRIGAGDAQRRKREAERTCDEHASIVKTVKHVATFSSGGRGKRIKLDIVHGKVEEKCADTEAARPRKRPADVEVQDYKSKSKRGGA